MVHITKHVLRFGNRVLATKRCFISDASRDALRVDFQQLNIKLRNWKNTRLYHSDFKTNPVRHMVSWIYLWGILPAWMYFTLRFWLQEETIKQKDDDVLYARLKASFFACFPALCWPAMALSGIFE